MINFLLLMLFPLLICCGYLVYLKGKESVGDIAIQLGIVAVLIAAGLGIAYWQGTADVEILNGQVTDKQRVKVSCEHSYECNCYYTTECTGSGSSRSCSQVRHCSTCYEHAYDVSWYVYSSIGDTTSIARVDRQGVTMPPRWGAAYVGEPYSTEHEFENYIKANPSSVLLGQKGDLKKFGALIPQYPDGIYDYYHATHAINMGVPGTDTAVWNDLVSKSLRTLGPSKQVNLVVLFVPTDDSSYIYALRDKWLGGKKNDAIIVIGSKDGNKIEWVDIVSWSTNSAFKVELKDRILALGYITRRDEIMTAITEETQKNFVRMHMKNMKYLVRNFQPSSRAMMILLVLGIIFSVGACIGSHLYHENNDYGYSRY